MTGPKHSCGVVGISAENNVVPALQKSLMIIQHRGQESAGISVYNSEGTIDTVKDSGLVQTALPKYMLSKLHGTVGIGHVRYPTTGTKVNGNAQPLTATTRYGPLAIAHNGDITNFDALKEMYLASGWSFFTDSDSELVTKIFSKYSAQHSDPIKALKATCGELDGAFSLVMLVDNRLFGIRDPRGMRPLCIGRIRDGYMLVSESAAIDALNGELIRDVMPGEIVEITPTEIISYPYNTSSPRAHCMFEWVYFARPDSVMDGREVYDVRRKIGEILARESPADVDLIMPIPDSGRAHAIGFSVESKIPYEEGFMKNRFAERTFILPDQRQREAAVSTKMNPIKSTVNGKRILIVDDSIVRGTTLKKLISMLRGAGATEVHVRIGCPPVIAPCYYGVDMKTRDQFIATDHSVDQIRQIIGADSLAYISVSGLIEAVGIPEADLCLACVCGKYPTTIPGEVHRYQSTLGEGFVGKSE
ncbi:MAG: amidophosphoribosyltransferase [Candidatus Methanomethylophilaceae archaeon]|jgi:amidophosphoribosyltransferase|nr:amidophosphoribosyltransferase [Candidatus Methanomethylophilaceae archaeon]MDY0252021.1 amidophosphoribosyltransferase [Candidatus Methanomethylophilaceae archaeon]